MLPLNIRREIASLRNRPGENFTAIALQRIQDHVNDVVEKLSAPAPSPSPAPSKPSPISVQGVVVAGTAGVGSAGGGGGGTGLAGNPLPLPPLGGVHLITTTTYTLLKTDYGQLLSFSNASPVTVTLPKGGSGGTGLVGTIFQKFFCFIENTGAGLVTLTPDATAPATLIDGAASLPLSKNTGLLLFFDGTNWYTERGFGGGGGAGGVNLQTGTTYTLVATDNAKLISITNAAAMAISLPSAVTLGATFWCSIENRGAGVATLTPAVGTIDGLASLALNKNQGIILYSDGTNWYTERGLAGGGIVSGGVNIQSGISYTVQASDNSKLIVFTSAATVAVTLPAANTLPQFYCVIEVIGTGKVVVTPSVGTIDGAATINLGSYTGIWIFADEVGNNWYAETGVRLSGVNAQTLAYSTNPGDEGKLITMNSATAKTITLVAPSAGYLNYFLSVENLGAGVCTLSPASGTIDGHVSIALNQDQGCMVFFDGTNWFTQRGLAAAGGGAGGGVNLQIGTAYTVVAGDNAKLVSMTNAAAMTITLTAAGTLGATFWCAIQNRGAGVMTITPAVGTIDGAANLTVRPGHGILVYSDGTNFYTQLGLGNAALLQGTLISATAPTDQQFLKYVNANSDWEPATLAASALPSVGINLAAGVAYITSGSIGFTPPYSILPRISGCGLIWTTGSWKLRLLFQTNTTTATSVTFSKIVVRRSPLDSLTPTDATQTTVTIGGSATPTVNIPIASPAVYYEVFTDPISLALDTTHDYWVVFVVSVQSATLPKFANQSGGVINPNLNAYFVAGDQSAATLFQLPANQNWMVSKILAA